MWNEYIQFCKMNGLKVSNLESLEMWYTLFCTNKGVR